MKKLRTQHIQKPRFIDPTNNNIVERLNGTVREREKVMRSTKEEIQTIADGIRNYYNFIRPHQSLNGKTPAQASRMNAPSSWKSLIEQATKHETELLAKVTSQTEVKEGEAIKVIAK